MSVCIASDVNLDHLAKVVSARIFFCSGTIFFFVITKDLGGDTLRFCNHPFSA